MHQISGPKNFARYSINFVWNILAHWWQVHHLNNIDKWSESFNPVRILINEDYNEGYKKYAKAAQRI